MEDTKEIRILIYSLELIGNFSEQVESINSSEEFLKIHKRNIDSLINLSKERETDYFKQKVAEYPNFSEIELEEFIKAKRNDKSLFSAIGGHFLSFIELIYKAAKTRGNSLGYTENKLKQLKSINDSIIYVVQNPGFEELIRNKNNA
jgi:hypothetical protein